MTQCKLNLRFTSFKQKSKHAKSLLALATCLHYVAMGENVNAAKVRNCPLKAQWKFPIIAQRALQWR